MWSRVDEEAKVEHILEMMFSCLDSLSVEELEEIVKLSEEIERNQNYIDSWFSNAISKPFKYKAKDGASLK